MSPWAALRVPASFGDEGGVEIRRVCADSRRVRPGDLFCALPGGQTHGREHVAAALEAGAVAVLHPGEGWDLPVPEWLVRPEVRPRWAAGRAAAAVAGDPSSELWTAAVTGTNGKTTVVHLLHHALAAAGIPVARIGTLGSVFGNLVWPGGLTTPPADEVQEFLREALDAGARAAVLEASSHGLDQDRLAGVEVDVAAWTNLTHDHLDYHGDLDRYAAAKARLFEGLAPDATALLPLHCEHAERALHACRARRIRWALGDASAELCGREGTDGETLVLEIAGALGPARITSRLVGRHNAENLLVAFGMARLAGLRAEEAAEALSAAPGPPGRLERVASDSPWRLFVDFAHTPDALARALGALRRAWPAARLGVVFGAGGDRDPSKRASMGRAAAEGADWCLVTSDNPRSEDPAAIAAAVAEGVRGAGRPADIECDRRAAIRRAVANLRPGDVLLVAGKGHETYQEVNGVKRDFDDRTELEAAAHCWA